MESSDFYLRAGCSLIVAQAIACFREAGQCTPGMGATWPTLVELDENEFAGLVTGVDRSGDLFKIWKKSGCTELNAFLSCILDASVYHELLHESQW
jgi:hypothetical protein